MKREKGASFVIITAPGVNSNQTRLRNQTLERFLIGMFPVLVQGNTTTNMGQHGT